jgi:hypothetical protein
MAYSFDLMKSVMPSEPSGSPTWVSVGQVMVVPEPRVQCSGQDFYR